MAQWEFKSKEESTLSKASFSWLPIFYPFFPTLLSINCLLRCLPMDGCPLPHLTFRKLRGVKSIDRPFWNKKNNLYMDLEALKSQCVRSIQSTCRLGAETDAVQSRALYWMINHFWGEGFLTKFIHSIANQGSIQAEKVWQSDVSKQKRKGGICDIHCESVSAEKKTLSLN